MATCDWPNCDQPAGNTQYDLGGEIPLLRLCARHADDWDRLDRSGQMDVLQRRFKNVRSGGAG